MKRLGIIWDRIAAGAAILLILAVLSLLPLALALVPPTIVEQITGRPWTWASLWQITIGLLTMCYALSSPRLIEIIAKLGKEQREAERAFKRNSFRSQIK